MAKCNWFFNSHCWHKVVGSNRKVRIHDEPPCKKNPDSMFISNETMCRGVKVVWLEKCCNCDKVHKEFDIRLDIESALKLPTGEDEPLSVDND